MAQLISWIYDLLFRNHIWRNWWDYPFPSSPPSSFSPCLRALVDLPLILQSPDSESAYKQKIEFIAKYTRSTDRDEVQACVIIVGQTGHKCIKSNDYRGQDDFEQALFGVQHMGGCTIEYALKIANEKFISTFTGRLNVKKIVLVVNEGDCSDEDNAVHEADKIKKRVTELMVVSVGSSDSRFLNRIASKNECVMTFQNNRELMEKGSEMVKISVCKYAPRFSSAADILFIIDSSGSIGSSDYEKELNFVKEITEKFTIGPRDAQFSAMMFSDQVEMIFPFCTLDHEQISRNVLNARHMQHNTNTAEALKMSRENVLRFRTREGYQRIIIIITDGASDDKFKTYDQAEALIKEDVRIIAIGVGSANREELLLLASTENDIFYVDNFAVLQDLQDRIADVTSTRESLNADDIRRHRENMRYRIQQERSSCKIS